MASSATIRPWYLTVGFAPDGGWTALLPDVIGRRRTAAVLLGDETITATQAIEWGLVHRVVPAGDVPGTAREVADRIALGYADAAGAARRLLAADRDRVVRALEAERAAFCEVVVGDEATAGMDAFLGGRLR
jgi:2-(1,2-epoxy-1,2-dihydrophenyl)acetyl-CoA isomerase